MNGGRRVVVAAAIVAATAVTSLACSPDEDASSPPETADGSTVARPSITVTNTEAWPMHPIDGRYRGANGLGAADVDRNGHTDYLTNYEFDQRWILQLHPGTDDADSLRVTWPTVEVWAPDPLVEGSGKNPESATLGDFDGDGNIDAAGAHGFSDLTAVEGSAPGVHIVWGPDAADVRDPDRWVDAGWIPATESIGHPHWVVAHDVNGDGLTDVAVGGRLHGGGGGYENPDSPNGNGTYTGIGWLEAPADRASRRDLTRWQFHRIDADEYSGHGFVFVDLDGDGDDDIADANADFDTPEDREAVAWYENPGYGSEAQRSEWTRTELLRDAGFYAKPSVAAGDLDGDGLPDLVTQTDAELIFFRNSGSSPQSFDTVRITKPPEIAWRSRPVRLADFDNDGDLDLFGMLIHDGDDLPADKAAAYVLLNEGDPWNGSAWDLVPVKWGAGVTMKVPGFGEKWDQVEVVDVDGDGDLDVVANCEEWWVEANGEVVPFFTEGLDTASVAVVWFENRLGEPPGPVEEAEQSVVVEAERPTVIGDSSWVTRQLGATQEAEPTRAAQALNAQPPANGILAPDDTAGADYHLQLTGGDYIVWARMLAPSTFGPDLGASASDSAWLAVDDGAAQVLGEPITPYDGWVWVRLPDAMSLSPGRHVLNLRVRERGVAVDQIVLTRDPAFAP